MKLLRIFGIIGTILGIIGIISSSIMYIAMGRFLELLPAFIGMFFGWAAIFWIEIKLIERFITDDLTKRLTAIEKGE